MLMAACPWPTLKFGGKAKNNMTIFKTKAFWLTYLAVLAVSAMGWYANVYIFRLRAVAPRATMSLSPRESTLAAGEEKRIDLIITPEDGRQKLSGFNITVRTTGSLELVRFEDAVRLEDNSPFGEKVRADITSPTVGVAVYVDTTSGDEGLTNAVRLPVVVKGTGDGTGRLTIDGAASEISGNIGEHIFIMGSIDEGTYTIGAGGETAVGPVKLNLQTRFQGITGKPRGTDKMTVKVKLAAASLGDNQPTSSATLTADDSGVFKGTAGFDVPAAPGYYLLVKGPRHVQKKICVSAPTEGTVGTYRCAAGQVTLALGDNPADLSGIRLLVGDLPLSEGGQNGVIDAADISYIRQNLGKTDASVVAVGDLNQDGVVDSQDYSLIIASLTVKYDEE